MASSSANSWIPHGRHEVQIGPSLNRALKARKGAPPPPAKRTGPPEKDFYSFRYNFKPPSVDNTKPGSIELTRSKDATTVAVEHASSQPGESYIYHGNETSAKEFDCVLIYDEETGSYKLEKLESYIVLTYDHKNTVSIPPPTPPTKVEDDTVYSMEDADGEPDDGEMPTQFIPAPQEEEEEEGEFEELLPPPPPPPVKPPAKAPPPPKQRPEPAVAPRPTKPVPQRKNTKKTAPPPVQQDANVEEFTDIARPSAKRAKRASSPVSFALPGMSMSNWVPPPAPAPLPTQNHRAAPPIPIPPPASPPAPASDSEEDDWDEVPPEPLVISAPAEEEAPQEIDLQDFEQTLEAAMEAEMGMDEDEEEEGSEPEDFLAEAMPQAPPDDAPARPLSMSQLGGFSEDEYSSSEDSDDD